MSNPLHSRLTRAALSTFEDLGFVVPEPDVAEERAAEPLRWGARVAFDGPVTGWLEVRVTAGFAGELAANMLGLEGEVDSRLQGDALGEIANVVCGNVVPELGGADAIFDLEAPAVTALHASGRPGDDGAVVVELGFENGRAQLALRVDGSPSRRGAA